MHRRSHPPRFLIQTTHGIDGAALELHHLPDGKFSGILLWFGDSQLAEHKVAALVKKIDEDMPLEANIDHDALRCTLGRGEASGSWDVRESSAVGHPGARRLGLRLLQSQSSVNESEETS